MNDLVTTNSSVARAEQLAGSDLVPKRFRGKTKNVLAILSLADRSGMEPISLMRSCYEVNGEYAIEAKAAIAMLEASGKIIGPPRYKIEGTPSKDLRCTAIVRDAQINEDISLTFFYATADKQGWTKNPHWKNDPRTMMRYRSIIQLIRSSYPSVLFGMYTIDEMRDMQTVQGSVVSSRSSSDENLAQRLINQDVAFDNDPAAEPEPSDEPTDEEKAEIVEAESLFNKGGPDYE